MQHSGTIQNLVPDGGYDGTHGRIYTFQMTVSTSSGNVTGQIGSKPQAYPMNLGAPITV